MLSDYNDNTALWTEAHRNGLLLAAGLLCLAAGLLRGVGRLGSLRATLLCQTRLWWEDAESC